MTERMVAVVTGATRGCGRAIAVELGARGATVFAVGRTTREHASEMRRPETIEETAELVDAAGGVGVPVRCDCTDPVQVARLAAQIESEVDGRLDVLVDDVWGGDPFVQHEFPFWESDLTTALRVTRDGLATHLVALHGLLPLLVRRGRGLLVEVTDGDTDDYPGSALPYYLVKSGIRRIGVAMAEQLRPHGVTALAVTPGFLRSEQMLDHFGVTEDNWRDGISTDPHYALSETPHYLGRGVAALATDPAVARFAGRTLSSWGLMHEYGVTDLDGSRPDWGRWFAEVVGTGIDPSTVDAAGYRQLSPGRTRPVS
ncbi:MAG TPA: SDR family oxidoreductase [Pseudonocardiaceae bacterium]|jgi:NAD(P)-dependent dehydrogenase (short-subunit alcohol dehydrogenase family)|nr:SDR family oxidoreductase [Pseudonocardiaceae bacterium]